MQTIEFTDHDLVALMAAIIYSGHYHDAKSSVKKAKEIIKEVEIPS